MEKKSVIVTHGVTNVIKNFEWAVGTVLTLGRGEIGGRRGGGLPRETVKRFLSHSREAAVETGVGWS